MQIQFISFHSFSKKKNQRLEKLKNKYSYFLLLFLMKKCINLLVLSRDMSDCYMMRSETTEIEASEGQLGLTR